MKASHRQLFARVAAFLVPLAASSAWAAGSPVKVQTAIEAQNGYRHDLPKDGSSCDPAVIARNLDALAKADLLDATNLTPTEAAFGACYGPCPEDIERAYEAHCAKAALLQEIVDLIATK